MKTCSTFVLCVLVTLSALLSAAPLPASPANADVPDLTTRQKDQLFQLADAEANIQAINKALVRTGYKVGVAYDRIDSNLKGNELMDRKGGGPVRWDEFYGRTARDYGSNGWGDQRPRQFDYIYKANNDQIDRARGTIAALEGNKEALLERRRTHEESQSRLWAMLAFAQIRDQEIDGHEIDQQPICRFALKPAGPAAGALRPIILFLRTADSVAADGLEKVKTDQPTTFGATGQRMEAAYEALKKSLTDALDAPDLKPSQIERGREIKGLCKDLSEQCAVIADNYAKALDSDNAREDKSKLEFRAHLQASLYTFAMKVGRLHEEVIKTAKEWSVNADKGTPTPDAVATVVIKSEHSATPEHPAESPSGDSKVSVSTEKWVSLFNGRNLSGWRVDGGDEKNIRVQDGEIVASGGVDVKTRSYLLSDRAYCNFILRLEFKPEKNSGGGIAVRAVPGEFLPQEKARIFDHPIVKLNDGALGRNETGAMVWIRDDWMVQPDKHAELAPLGSWNRMEIQVRGHSLKVIVNDTVIAETTSAEGARLRDGSVPGLNRVKGLVGIQKHHGTIRYRNIEVMELPQ